MRVPRFDSGSHARTPRAVAPGVDQVTVPDNATASAHVRLEGVERPQVQPHLLRRSSAPRFARKHAFRSGNREGHQLSTWIHEKGNSERLP